MSDHLFKIIGPGFTATCDSCGVEVHSAAPYGLALNEAMDKHWEEVGK